MRISLSGVQKRNFCLISKKELSKSLEMDEKNIEKNYVISHKVFYSGSVSADEFMNTLVGK